MTACTRICEAVPRLSELESDKITHMSHFAAYFDESGTHGSPILTLAGYIGTIEQWAEFSREWDELLRHEGLTHFHMSKFEARRGEFEGWDNERRLRVQKRT